MTVARARNVECTTGHPAECTTGHSTLRVILPVKTAANERRANGCRSCGPSNRRELSDKQDGRSSHRPGRRGLDREPFQGVLLWIVRAFRRFWWRRETGAALILERAKVQHYSKRDLRIERAERRRWKRALRSAVMEWRDQGGELPNGRAV